MTADFPARRPLARLARVVATAMLVAISCDPAAAFALTIRVYDVYGLSPSNRQAMLSVVSTALVDAGVTAEIVDCSGARPAAACQLPLAPTELVLRIHRLPPDGSHALGVAFIHAEAGAEAPEPNTIATIYATHVADMARRSRMAGTMLMGLVAAHELGHLLIGSNQHAPAGLMRGSWSWLLIQRARPEDWRFSAADAATIRLRLERRQALPRSAAAGLFFGEGRSDDSSRASLSPLQVDAADRRRPWRGTAPRPRSTSL